MAKKFGEFIGYSIIAVCFLLFLTLSYAISYWALSWTFGWAR